MSREINYILGELPDFLKDENYVKHYESDCCLLPPSHIKIDFSEDTVVFRSENGEIIETLSPKDPICTKKE